MPPKAKTARKAAATSAKKVTATKAPTSSKLSSSAATGNEKGTTTIKMYAIPNCDTVKKARQWLDSKGLAYEFHDYKKLGISETKLQHWMDKVGWDKVTNSASATYKGLSDSAKSKIVDAKSAIPVVQKQVSIIKRPVVEWNDGRVTLGFKADEWNAAYKA